MHPVRRQIGSMALKIFDLSVMIFCFFFASYLVNASAEYTSFIDLLSIRISVQNFLVFAGIIAAWHVIFSQSGIYEKYRLSTLRSLILDIFKIAFFSTLVLLALKIIFGIRVFNVTYLGTFWGLVCALTIAGRIAIRLLLRQLRRSGRNQRSILFVGKNRRSLALARKIAAMPEFGYRILGFVDDHKSKLHDLPSTDLPFIGFEELQEFLRDNVVDEIMLCLPLKSFYAKASEVISSCEEQGIIVRLFSDHFNLKYARSETTVFENETITTIYTGEMVGNMMILKRMLDFLLSLALVFILSPLLLFTCLLIKLTSPGPIIFAQERIGLNKRRFRVFKFRTMYPDAEKRMAEVEHLNEVSGPVFKIKNDPRITPIGRFLRKTSIDELPQLFNVLRGDMSLVGPRPLPVRDYSGFSQDWHRRRLSVRPGITCLWQISGRSNISFDQWMELDMRYIDNWSLWLDLKILVGTIPAVLKGSGAA